MNPLLGWYLFFLGVAAGCVLVTLTVYQKVTPRWLRWLLLALGLLTVSRYVTMALAALSDDPRRWWALRHCWFASTIGLTTPAVLVIDQLLRHPALSPKKMLRWFSPFLIAYLVIILLGRYETRQDPVAGWVPMLVGWSRLLLSLVQTLFVCGFAVICVLAMRLMRSRSVRGALAALLIGFLYLGLDGILLALGRTYFRPFLFSEMLTLLALGHAYDVALRRASSA